MDTRQGITIRRVVKVLEMVMLVLSKMCDRVGKVTCCYAFWCRELVIQLLSKAEKIQKFCCMLQIVR